MELIYILTYDCNFRCTYCDIDKRKEDMPKKVIDDSLIFLRENNFDIDKVKFFWWEPLLKKQYIEQIVKNFPIKYSPTFYSTSNSTLITKDFVDFVKSNKFKLTFSIDGTGNTTNENRKAFTWNNLWDLIIQNTKKYANDIRINQVITSKNSDNFFNNFKYIYDLWVREFNFLPEYYAEWTKEWLKNLQKWFYEILDFYKKGNKFQIVNLDNYSETAFFNLGLIIDTTWDIYGTNLILAWTFEKYKPELKIWNIYNWLQVDIHDDVFVNWYIQKVHDLLAQEYDKKVLKSVEYVDLILNNFCNEYSKIK